MKKSIAIVGATGVKGKEIAVRLSQTKYSLLLVSDDNIELEIFFQHIKKLYPGADVEVAHCVKDGCWEADVIILAIRCDEEQKIAELMKEVATQKIVVKIPDGNGPGLLEGILTYSKLVTVEFSGDLNQVKVKGKHLEANNEVIEIFNNAGYNAKITL